MGSYAIGYVATGLLVILALATGSQAALGELKTTYFLITKKEWKLDHFYLIFLARTAFEKLTDFDYRGTTYYSVRNLSLYECQGWCREEAQCQAAAFSFVVNPLAPMQDTLCQLQNETSSTNPAAQPQRAANMYYMTKLQIRSGKKHAIFIDFCFNDVQFTVGSIPISPTEWGSDSSVKKILGQVPKFVEYLL